MDIGKYDEKMVTELIISEAQLKSENMELKEKLQGLEKMNLSLTRQLNSFNSGDSDRKSREVFALQNSIFILREKVSLISHAIETLSRERSIHGLLQQTVKLLNQVFETDSVTVYFNKEFRPYHGITNEEAVEHLNFVVYDNVGWDTAPIPLVDMPQLLSRLLTSENSTFDLNRIDLKELSKHGTLSAVITKLSINGELYGFILLESTQYNIGSEDVQFLNTLSAVISNLIAQLSLSVKLSTYLQHSLTVSATDSLTHLQNKFALDTKIAELDASDDRFTFIFCDLNYLKQFNDGYSHSMGDRALITFAEELRNFMDSLEGDAYRISGDEFLGICGKSKEEVDKHLDDFRRKLEQRGINEGLPLPLSAAVGVYEQRYGETATECISKADKLMYENKRVMKS